ALAAAFFVVSFVFVYLSFYAMRIKAEKPDRRKRLRFQNAGEVARIVVEAREDLAQVAHPEMLLNDLAEDAAKVGGDGEVAPLIKLAVVQTRPFRIDLATLDVATHHEHAVGVAVVGATVAVLVRGAAELRHAEEDDVRHLVAHVLMERGEALAEVAQQIRKLALHAAFVYVMVPAAAIEESDLEADVRFDELGNFHEALPVTALRILRAVRGLIIVGMEFLQAVNRFEGFLADAVHGLIHGLRVHRFKAAFDGLLRAGHAELAQIRQRHRGRGALEGSRQVWPKGNGAEGR